MLVEKMTYSVHQLLHNDIFRTPVVVPFQDNFSDDMRFSIFEFCMVLS